MAERFYCVDTASGNRYAVNIEYVIALREKGEDCSNGAILYLHGGAGDGSRLALELSPAEARNVRQWLYSS